MHWRPDMISIRALVRRQHSLAISILVLIAVGDVLCNIQAGISFQGWFAPLSAVLLLLTISGIYVAIRPGPKLAELAAYAAIWIAFTTAGGIQTYLASSASAPLVDSKLIAFDQALGFEW